MRPSLILALAAAYALAMLPSCSTQFMQARETAEPRKHRQCSICHLTNEPRKGGQLFAQGVEPSTVCLKCHAYLENHHPVNFAPVDSAFASSGKTFPLFNNEIRCLTCHDPHGGPGMSKTRRLLRGGPYADRREQCFQCHYQERYAEIDPHIMLDGNGQFIAINGKPVCLLCHAALPDPAKDRTEDIRLRAEVTFLCWRCHPPMPGQFMDYHFNVIALPQTVRRMKKAEREMEAIFPLMRGNRTTCSTCHNPHQKEVITHAPAKTGADSLKRLRIQTPAICAACHGKK